MGVASLMTSKLSCLFQSDPRNEVRYIRIPEIVEIKEAKNLEDQASLIHAVETNLDLYGCTEPIHTRQNNSFHLSGT